MESSFHSLNINFVVGLDVQEDMGIPQVSKYFLTSPWYADIVYVL